MTVSEAVLVIVVEAVKEVVTGARVVVTVVYEKFGLAMVQLEGRVYIGALAVVDAPAGQ